MKHILLLSFAILLLSEAASAQGVTRVSANGAASSATNFWMHTQATAPPTRPFGSLAADVPISYYDPAAPMLGFVTRVQLGPYFMITYGERITLPGTSGLLDSLQVTLDTIVGDSVMVYLIPDTLYSTATGDVHLMNIFDPNTQTYLIGYIHQSDVHGMTTVTFPMSHTAIRTQNFWIAVEPHFDATANSFTSVFRIIGDSEAIRGRTPDNSHSGFLAIVNSNQFFSGSFDSTFIGAGGAAVYSNFYIKAFVSASGSSVSNNSNEKERLGAYPNPASNSILFEGIASDISNIEFLDALGRTVLSTKDAGMIDVSQLMPGRYEAIVHTPGGRTVLPVMIQR